MNVSYIRVSTKKQNIGRQELLLNKCGIKFEKKYVDKVSGKSRENRNSLNEMIKNVKEGDAVYAESISRLARNLKDLINIIEELTNKSVRVVILKEGIDSNSSTYKLLLGIFGAIAEMERETIQERVLEGIEQCKITKRTRTGRWFGRERKKIEDLPKNFDKYYSKLKMKEITKIEMARLLGISRSTLYRWLKLKEIGDE